MEKIILKTKCNFESIYSLIKSGLLRWEECNLLNPLLLMVLLSILLNKLPCSFLRSKTKFIVRPPHPQKNHQRIQKEKIQTTFWKNTVSTKRAILPVVWTLQARLVAVPKTLTIIVALWFRLNKKRKQREEKYNVWNQ